MEPPSAPPPRPEPAPTSPAPPPPPPAPPRRMVLDTSIFTNPEIRAAFGPSPTAALAAFLQLARSLRGVEFYMPPSIWTELGNFIDASAIPADAELVIQRKPPNKFELTVPAFLLYELIEDVRRRVDKGLRLAEEAVRGGRPGAEDERIAALRKKYREALREGIIDSTEDVELILLAKELGAIVVSADRGVVTWAEKLGLRWIDPAALKGVLESLARH